ncbi:alkaline phosphatase family protein [Melioribacter sp. OK-6-Me]|uniref:alkaline phosphatase family protein n=1 Tax=unclassified Melioribacter TaxID=2627329 RepID=UPI003F5CE381
MLGNIFLAILLLLFNISNNVIEANDFESKAEVKLVLQIVVDQLRADYLNKYSSNFSKSGFNYLIKEGVNFSNAKLSYTLSATGPGHASIATGSLPAYHGIISNDWYNRKLKQKVYCAEYNGVKSPLNLIGSTLSDEIYLSSGGKSKIFGISSKDRGAIFLAGHYGKAFWLSDDSIQFTTSSYYYEKEPEFLENFNKKINEEYLIDFKWEPLYEPEKYINYFGQEQLDNFGLKRFNKPSEVSSIITSPLGDFLTLQFAKHIIYQNELGKDEYIDYLSISFSSTDKIGHYFGNSSIEFEDQLYRLDKLIAELVDFINSQIGMNNTLIILTSDHGAKDSFTPTNGNKNSNLQKLEVDGLRRLCNEYIKEKLNVNFDVIEEIILPNIYLNEEAIINNGLEISVVEFLLKDYLRNMNNIYDVFTSTEIEKNNLSPTALNIKVINSYFHKRSGNLYIIFEPSLPDSHKIYNRSEHGTPWNYDLMIPLLFCGPRIDKGKNSSQEAYIEDIAVTVSHYLGIKVPATATGKVLPIFGK